MPGNLGVWNWLPSSRMACVPQKLQLTDTQSVLGYLLVDHLSLPTKPGLLGSLY